MHDCNGTTTGMKQRPEFCMSDVISILKLFQETGEGLLKAGVGGATLTPLLSAFISNHTHKDDKKNSRNSTPSH